MAAPLKGRQSGRALKEEGLVAILEEKGGPYMPVENNLKAPPRFDAALSLPSRQFIIFPRMGSALLAIIRHRITAKTRAKSRA